MKRLPIYLLNIAGIALLAVLIHIIVDNPVHNSIQNEQPSPSPSVRIESSPNPTPENGEVKSANTVAPTAPKHEDSNAGEPCGSSEAEAAGWKILSCDPLRLMQLDEWNTKIANPHFKYRPELYCFDESNFAGVFHVVEAMDYPDKNSLDEMKLGNGCSFFFHPNQGQGNMMSD